MQGKSRWRVFFFAAVVLALLSASSFSSIGISGQNSGTFKSAHVLGTDDPDALTQLNESIELGYSQETLVPVSAGVPTFTLGDEMWMLVESNSTTLVQLLTPSGQLAENETIQPEAATRIFVFTANYNDEGSWTLVLSGPVLGSSRNISIAINFVNPSNHPMQAAQTSYGFSGSQLAVNFSLSSPGSYGISGCLLPTLAPAAILLQTPPASLGSDLALQNAGNGSISISTGGRPVVYAPNASKSVSLPTENASAPKQPFEFWVELYYLYSYQTGGTQSSYTTTYQEVARTDPVLLSATNEVAFPQIETLGAMRNGTYELRSFFEVGNNLTVEQTSILVQGIREPWISLEGCSMAPLNGQTFTATLKLSNSSSSSSSQPATLLISYFYGGVELYLLQPLTVRLSELTLFIGGLQQVPSNIGIAVSVVNGTYEIVGESVFIASPDLFVELNYSLSFGGKVFDSSPQTYVINFGTVDSNLGKMSVLVSRDGRWCDNATVYLTSDALNATVELPSNSQGNATFFGPAGNYSLKVSVNGTVVTRNVSIRAGQSSTVNVALNTNSNSGLLTAWEFGVIISVLAVACVGIVANIWLWLFRRRPSMAK